MPRSSAICVDANIIVRLTLSSQDPVNALWLSWHEAGMQVVAPALLYYEVANSLHQYQKHGLLSAEAIRRLLYASLVLPVKLISDPALHRRALELAAAYRLPAAYDAHYLALAERLGVELWTTDARLVNVLQPFQVEWVKLAGR